MVLQLYFRDIRQVWRAYTAAPIIFLFVGEISHSIYSIIGYELLSVRQTAVKRLADLHGGLTQVGGWYLERLGQFLEYI